MSKQLLVVLGMHRSGTSALTRGLKVLGVELGENLLAADEKVNAKGFWEDKDILRLNVELLAELGLDWDSVSIISAEQCHSEQLRRFLPRAMALLQQKMDSVACFGLKDPRVSILLPFWQQVFELLNIEVTYIISSRNPLSVVQSLARRDNMLPEHSLLLWQNYMLACLSHTQGRRRLVVEYQKLMTEPALQLQRIATLAGLPLDEESDEFNEYAHRFLDAGLCHSQFDINSLEASAAATCEQVELYRLLVLLAEGSLSFEAPQYTDTIARLANVQASLVPILHLAGVQSRCLHDAQARLAPLEQEKETLGRHIGTLEQEKEALVRHIGALDAQITELKQYVTELEPLKLQLEQRVTHQERAQQELVRVSRERDELERFAESLLLSRSWRLTAPLRWVGQLWRGEGDEPGTLVMRKGKKAAQLGLLAGKQPGLVAKGVRYWWQNGRQQTLERMREIMQPDSHYFPASSLDVQEQVVILTTPHCHYLAQLVQDALAKVGKTASIIHEEPKDGFGQQLHFVICAQMFKRLPPFYIVWQMEQSVSSRWFTPEYISSLENSLGVFDYSSRNIEFLQQQGLSYRQLYYLPVGYRQSDDLPPRQENVDVLFYGDINNERRRHYIERLQQQFTVEVVSNLFGTPLYEKMARAKVIVNIHYYEGALLETTRLYECLSQQQIVVSEESVDMDEHSDLHSRVDFVPINDVEAMVERVAYWVEKSANARMQRRQEITADCEQQPSWFEFYFLRMLLAVEQITFEQFYQAVAHHVRFEGNFVCLGLPETVTRRNDFNHDNHYGIEYFPGLRHRLGWVGCGLSYKFLLRRAKDLGLPFITICEDDVEFRSGFAQRYQKVLAHLEQRNDWDLFAGLIAQIHEDMNILDTSEQQGERYITIDTMVSMVMNIYSSRFYDKLMAWDHENHDAERNTIDRFIEQHGSIRAITTPHFLVGHKEELDSTLWGFNNTTYSQMIADSEARLSELVEQYDASEQCGGSVVALAAAQ